jgi:hypothetical protein
MDRLDSPAVERKHSRLAFGLRMGSQSGEVLLRGVYLRQVAAHVVFTAALPPCDSKSASRVQLSCGSAAQVNQRGKVLLALKRGGSGTKGLSHLAIEQGSGQFDRMAWQHPGIETIEPA